jgi:two-component system, OmpR family, KDP operon response regulator KdpE
MNQPAVRVLIVDDERPIRRFLRAALSAHGYDVYEAGDGQGAEAALLSSRPDVVILDLGLPDIEGTELTRRWREWTGIPIIILSVRGHETDKIAALDAGADDYLTKPFSIGELMARLRVALRRAARPGAEPVFHTGGLTLDLAHRRVTLDGQEMTLTPTEYDLLRVLAADADRVLTHRQLLRQVWGAAYEQETHLLRVNISNLRRKIEADPSRPQYVITEPGVGYRLRSDAERAEM